MAEEFRKGANAETPEAGPFLAKIVSHLDPTYMGTLEVQILHESGNDEDREGQLRTVKYLNPFYGSTHIEYVSDAADTHDNTQKAYGMWMIPPDVGTIVMVIFIGGDTRKGFWMGCVQNEDMNFAVPGYAATQYVSGDSRETDTEKERVPAGEYNKIIHPDTESDTTKKDKPEHPGASAMEKQGLLKDDIRGITTSSARREVPSMVFGISTPGPVDKAGKQGKVGKHEHKIPNAFVSRLGGSSFVMDDGDDKFLRKKPASEGPPEYAAVELGETDGIKTILHNELIRLRTRTGHQILMHNSEDLIYIGNSRGTAWIELTSDGKMEVYAEDSISFRTKQDFNFYADRDINMEAGRNFNTKVKGEKHTHVIGDQILIVDGNQKIHVKQDVDKTYEQNYKQHVKQDVDKLFDQNYNNCVKQQVNKLYETSFLHTVYNSVTENFATQSGTVKTTTGGNTDVIINGNLKITQNGTLDHTVTGYRKLTTGGGLDINTTGSTKIASSSGLDINTTGSNKFTASGNTEVKSGGENLTSAVVRIANNRIVEAPSFDSGTGNAGTAATAATAAPATGGPDAECADEAVLPQRLKLHTIVDLTSQDEWQSLISTESIVRRMPTPEPYPHHENLDPLNYKPDKLDRDKDGRYESTDGEELDEQSAFTEDMNEPAGAWRTYSTSTDTFAKVPAPNQQPEEE
jgi:hypothetical protein